MINNAFQMTKMKRRFCQLQIHGDLVKAIGTPHAAVYDERVVYDGIKIDATLPAVWRLQIFYLGDQFSHCGVNVLS